MLVGPLIGQGGIGRPTRRSSRVGEAHTGVQEGSEGIGRPTQMFGRGRETHPEVWEGR